MKFKLTLVAFIGVLFLGISTGKAQTSTPDFTAGHLRAAERMLVVSGMQDNVQKMFDQIIALQSKQIPEADRAAFVDVMNKFLQKYANWEEIKRAFVPIYAAEFSEDELNQIADFLSTPAGKAMTNKSAELFQKGAEWGTNLFHDHQSEMEEMMKTAMSGANKN